MTVLSAIIILKLLKNTWNEQLWTFINRVWGCSELKKNWYTFYHCMKWCENNQSVHQLNSTKRVFGFEYCSSYAIMKLV